MCIESLKSLCKVNDLSEIRGKKMLSGSLKVRYDYHNITKIYGDCSYLLRLDLSGKVVQHAILQIIVQQMIPPCTGTFGP